MTRRSLWHPCSEALRVSTLDGMSGNSWDDAYRSGRVPWDPGRHDTNIETVLEMLDLQPCSVLDIGCGSGGTLVYLAERGFRCTGVDVAPTAIEIARERAAERGVACEFIVDSFPEPFADRQRAGSYELLIDRGFFHLHTSPADQRAFTRAAARLLAPGRPWYSLIASDREGPGSGGPPRWSKSEVHAAAGDHLDVEAVVETAFTPDASDPMPAWLTIYRRTDRPIEA